MAPSASSSQVAAGRPEGRRQAKPKTGAKPKPAPTNPAAATAPTKSVPQFKTAKPPRGKKKKSDPAFDRAGFERRGFGIFEACGGRCTFRIARARRRNGYRVVPNTPLYRDVFASSAAAALSNTLCRLASVVGGSAFKEAASNTAQVAAASLPALAVNRRGLFSKKST